MEHREISGRFIESPHRPTAPTALSCGDDQALSSSPRRYQYHPLKTPSTQVRLFRIRPRTKANQDLRCEMTRHSLPCEPGIIYSAISYMWKPEHPYQYIRINGRSHRIGHNLYRFLIKLSEAGEEGLLWADALCINQDDLEERNAQVAVMSAIYQHARQVFSWVGEEDEESQMLLQRLASRKAMHWRTWDPESERGRQRWDALEAFRKRKYWTRMWIVPEILSQPQSRVVICCGDDFVTLERLHAVCDFALAERSSRYNSSSDDDRRLASAIRGSEMLHLSHKCGHMQLWDLLERHVAAACADPRDKVYALLSAAEDTASLECPLRPDYGKDVRTLITDVLLFCRREETRWLRMLVGCMVPGEREPRTYREWKRRWPASIEV